MTTLTNDQNEQLFTDLTSEEAEIIEGGGKVFLSKVIALSLTRDDRDNRPRADEVWLYVKGQKKWGWRTLYPGSTGRGINMNVNINSLKDIEFREYDRGNANDRITYARGVTEVTSRLPDGRVWSRHDFTGNGAVYRLKILG